MLTAAILLCRFPCPRTSWACLDYEESTRIYCVPINPLVEPS
jgi:hypothetical protein